MNEESSKNMISVAVVERDLNGDSMLAWSYPATDKELDRIILQRSRIEQLNVSEESLLWTRHQNSWLYLLPCEVKSGDAALAASISRFVICVQAKDFDPEKYANLTQVKCPSSSCGASE